ncbi:hypothetical protein [Microbulbifer sp. GL-2]|uniref:hypothetical protein n=1 Tax=Microbulbifer sp. GL-2 TaxID=2591606 RepID=UPI001163D86B|nr:hypothetical protein [Microbulbifer sp. GL-2]BBM00344.1 hypothetical protein GL2_04180 [Microbulbifer sp. GL-2]
MNPTSIKKFSSVTIPKESAELDNREKNLRIKEWEKALINASDSHSNFTEVKTNTLPSELRRGEILSSREVISKTLGNLNEIHRHIAIGNYQVTGQKIHDQVRSIESPVEKLKSGSSSLNTQGATINTQGYYKSVSAEKNLTRAIANSLPERTKVQLVTGSGGVEIRIRDYHGNVDEITHAVFQSSKKLKLMINRLVINGSVVKGVEY